MDNSQLLSSVIVVAPVSQIPPERRISLYTLCHLDLLNFHRNTAVAWYRHAYAGEAGLDLRQLEAGMSALTNELWHRLTGQPRTTASGSSGTATAQARTPSTRAHATSPLKADQKPQPVSRTRHRGFEM